MADEGPSKKSCIRKLQTSPPTLDERSKRVNELLIPYIALLAQSSDSTGWLPATVWFCGLLLGEDPPTVTILNSRVVPAFILLLTKKDIPELQVEAAKALTYLPSGTSEATKLTKYQVQGNICEAVDPACEALRHLVNSKDESVLVHACCALAVLSGCDNAEVTELIRCSDLHHRLLELIGHRTLIVAALRTLGNIMEGNTCLIDWCISSGKILDILQVCLAVDYVEIRREACWIISYITAEKGRWIQLVCDVGLIEEVVDVALEDEFVVMEAAVHAISNAASGATVEQIRFMLSRGCLEPLCYLFYSRNSDIFNVCLEGLDHMLKAGADVVNPYMEAIEGWTSLKRSAHNYEEELFKKAHEIMVKYGAMSPDAYKWRLDFRYRYDDD